MKTKTNAPAKEAGAKAGKSLSERKTSESKDTKNQRDDKVWPIKFGRQLSSKERYNILLLTKYMTILSTAYIGLLTEGKISLLYPNRLDCKRLGEKMLAMIENAEKCGYFDENENEDVNLARRAWRWNS